MRLAQAGDSAAYLQLLTEILPLLRRFVRGRGKMLQIQDVEDLVQDILLSLHAVRATYDPTRPFMPWLLAIARNRIADGARRSMRRAAHETLVERYPETFCDKPTNIHPDGYSDPTALTKAIRALPPKQRMAIEMVKMRELSLKESAAQSGMSVAAIKVAVHRGMRQLRRVLSVEA
jgi:RNA polymerase sigma-70 factor (ECF subfamily)